MKCLTPSPVIALAVIGTQLLGPAVLWAADQRGVRIEATRRVVVSALSGDQLTLQNGGGTKTLQFREGVAAGDRLTTGDRTMAEVLIGNRAVVTVGQGTAVQFMSVAPEQTSIQVSKGTVRVAAAASALGEQGLVTVQTPTGQVQTRGGIVRVLVDAPVRAAEQSPTGEARPYLASYTPPTLLAAVNTRGDVIQVEEGTAEILGAGPGAKAVTVQAGQAVGVQAGQTGPIVGITMQDTLRPGVVATAGHRSTPKEGMDNLVALQVDQATQLGNALTGAAETGEGEAGKKDESGKALNGATGGVALANAVANALFGNGNTSNPASGNAANQTGAGYGGNNNNGFGIARAAAASVKVNGGTAGLNGKVSNNALLVFTRKDPVAPYLNGVRTTDLFGIPHDQLTFKSEGAVVSSFTVAKELVLIGGSNNFGHGGLAPDQTLIVRGAANFRTSSAPSFNNLADSFFVDKSTFQTVLANNGLFPSDRAPVGLSVFNGDEVPLQVVAANSTFVPHEPSEKVAPGLFIGGTLSRFSNRSDGLVLSVIKPDGGDGGQSYVDGAITATGAGVVLTGGVTLDQGTKATIGLTEATNTYYTSGDSARQSLIKGLGTTYSGSLLSVINGPNNSPTSLTMQDRLLGVYDGSTVCGGHPECGINGSGNKALLSVLDAKLKGPGGSIPLIDIAAGTHFNEPPVVGTPVTPDSNFGVSAGSSPDVKVTSAVVVRSTVNIPTIPLDGALLDASAPLLALTNATMTTSSHFVDLAGNAGNKTQAMLLNGTLVALDAASKLFIGGNLLNLNAATATINGYLFSLNNGSTLTISNGALFNLTGNSALNLNGNAFGVFGSGANTLSITNTFCNAACGVLVNSANQPFQLGNGTTLKVAGVTGNVMLPSTFNVFAGPATSTVNIASNAALFKVESGSTLTINGTSVIKR